MAKRNLLDLMYGNYGVKDRYDESLDSELNKYIKNYDAYLVIYSKITVNKGGTIYQRRHQVVYNPHYYTQTREELKVKAVIGTNDEVYFLNNTKGKKIASFNVVNNINPKGITEVVIGLTEKELEDVLYSRDLPQRFINIAKEFTPAERNVVYMDFNGIIK